MAYSHDGMNMLARAKEFFALLDNTDAGTHVAQYPLDVIFSSEGDKVLVSLREGRAVAVTTSGCDASIGYWTLELQGDASTLAALFAGAWTMGEAMYRGRLFAPEEKAKHNLVSELGQTIRRLQDEHRRVFRPN